MGRRAASGQAAGRCASLLAIPGFGRPRRSPRGMPWHIASQFLCHGALSGLQEDGMGGMMAIFPLVSSFISPLRSGTDHMSVLLARIMSTFLPCKGERCLQAKEACVTGAHGGKESGAQALQTPFAAAEEQSNLETPPQPVPLPSRVPRPPTPLSPMQNGVGAVTPRANGPMQPNLTPEVLRKLLLANGIPEGAAALGSGRGVTACAMAPHVAEGKSSSSPECGARGFLGILAGKWDPLLVLWQKALARGCIRCCICCLPRTRNSLATIQQLLFPEVKGCKCKRGVHLTCTPHWTSHTVSQGVRCKLIPSAT